MSFDIFWAQYPRKMAKPVASKAWAKLSTIEQAEALEALPNHLIYWKATETEKMFIPHPATWLNQQRFYDELELPEAKPKLQLVAWWSTDAGILTKGRELGIEPRPGETMYTFKDRVAERVRVAA